MAKRRMIAIRTECLDEFCTDKDKDKREAHLEISCDGERGRITCRASVHYHSTNTTGFASTTHLMFSDYSKTLESVKARATQKAIDSVFARYTTDEAKAALVDLATAHYISETA